MRISECVHSFYAADSAQPPELRTLLFLDYDPVLPGWPPEDDAVDRRRKEGRAVGDGLIATSDRDLRQGAVQAHA
jgi:hypothetical protein